MPDKGMVVDFLGEKMGSAIRRGAGQNSILVCRLTEWESVGLGLCEATIEVFSPREFQGDDRLPLGGENCGRIPFGP